MDTITTIPNWLTPTAEDTPLVTYPSTTRDISLKELVFENFFESSLDALVEGRTIRSLIQEDNRNISEPQFMRWILKDKTRKQRYHEALEVAAEIMLPDLIPTARGDGINEVERDKLVVNTMVKAMSFMSPNRFGKDTTPTGGSSIPVINISFGSVESPYTTTTLSTPTNQQVIDV
jgi:hypothetical protein